MFTDDVSQAWGCLNQSLTCRFHVNNNPLRHSRPGRL
jgi:hypothetical protein